MKRLPWGNIVAFAACCVAAMDGASIGERAALFVGVIIGMVLLNVAFWWRT